MNFGKLRLVLFLFCLLGISAVEVAFTSYQGGFLTVEGGAIYDMKTYRDQKVKVYITEDGKPYKTIYANSKGEFQERIGFNHTYIFNLSMDYHGTSKVLVDTRVPDHVDTKSAGGFFEFRCQMFELLEGLNTSILNKPIMKMKYVEEKERFEFDKAYTESLRFDLEGFMARIDELKQRRKEVLKDEEEANAAVAAAPKPKKERKVIEFEKEKEKPVAVNKRGHRNIMDALEEEEEEVVEEEIAVVEESEEEETEKLELTATPEAAVTEEIFLDEEMDESEFTALNIVPKRIKIDKEVKSSPQTEEVETEKQIIQQKVEMTRMEEETKIREEVNSYNKQVFVQKEMRLTNKKIQTDRLRELIKTIALAEIYFKKEYYSLHPIEHNYVIPSVVVYNSESWLVDEEKVMVRYPNQTSVYSKKTYPFGMTYYYKDNEEIDEAAYCAGLSELSKNQYQCVN